MCSKISPPFPSVAGVTGLHQENNSETENGRDDNHDGHHSDNNAIERDEDGGGVGLGAGTVHSDGNRGDEGEGATNNEGNVSGTPES